MLRERGINDLLLLKILWLGMSSASMKVGTIMAIKTHRLLISFLIILLLVLVYLLILLYSRGGFNKTELTPPMKGFDISPGELVVDQSSGGLARPYLAQTINNVWIKDIKVIEPFGKLPRVDLVLGYLEGGVEREFTVDVVGQVHLGEFVEKDGSTSLNSMGRVDVDKIPFVRGEFLTLSFVYFSESGGGSRLKAYCLINDEVVCSGYPDLGFGESPVSGGKLIYDITSPTKKIGPPEFALRSYYRNFRIPNKYEVWN